MPDYELQLAKATDKYNDMDEQLFQLEFKVKKAQDNIKNGLDMTGQIQRHVDELMQKIGEQKELLKKQAEIVAVLETMV